MRPEVAVYTEKLTRRFGKFVAVDQVTLEVKKGEIFAFLGPNGAGKTTLMRMLCGLLKPTTGKAMVGGFDIYTQTESIKQSIGYMSQKFSLYEDLTIEENIEFYGGIYGLSRESIRRKREEIFKNLKLASFSGMMTRDLPLGFKQRLALGCAMLHKPTILFLDEPTSGVDPKARRTFWEIIHETTKNGTTVLVTTHYMEEAEYCNRVCIMNNGQVVALDSPSKLREYHHQPSIQKVFVNLIKQENRSENSY